MSTSDITVSALAASPTLSGNVLTWTVTDPWALSGLATLKLNAVEVWSSTTNDRATAAKVGEGAATFTHGAASGSAPQYYWAKARDNLGAYGAWYPSGANSGVACAAISISTLSPGMANGTIVATASAGALTIAIKTLSGADPSASDPVYVTFRDATTGVPTTISLTAATSLVLSSGSTLGAVAANALRVWVLLINDSGTVRVAAVNCRKSTTESILSLPSDINWGTTAEGGAGAADNAWTIYTNTAVVSATQVIAGYLQWDSGLATPGTWTALSKTRLYVPGGPRPGDTLQEGWKPVTATSSGTTTIPFDDTIPQSSEGDLIWNFSDLTSRGSPNIIEHDIVLNLVHSISGTTVIAAVGGGALVGSMLASTSTAASPGAQLALKHRHLSIQTEGQALTFDVRAGGSAAGTLYVNGNASGRRLGGSQISGHRLREIMG